METTNHDQFIDQSRSIIGEYVKPSEPHYEELVGKVAYAILSEYERWQPMRPEVGNPD